MSKDTGERKCRWPIYSYISSLVFSRNVLFSQSKYLFYIFYASLFDIFFKCMTVYINVINMQTKEIKA